jgi:hypothetical protein
MPLPAEITVAVLHKAWKLFGPFNAANNAEIAKWVQTQCQELDDNRDSWPAFKASIGEVSSWRKMP